MNTENMDEVGCELIANYVLLSRWTLDFDLKDVHEWYIKRDMLYVKHQKNDEDYVDYEPEHSAFDGDSIKYPTSLYLDDEEV
jgi:hypothetical protein